MTTVINEFLRSNTSLLNDGDSMEGNVMPYSMRDVNRKVKELKADGLKIQGSQVEVYKLRDSYITRVTVKYLNDFGGNCAFSCRIGEKETLTKAKKRQRDAKASLKRNGC